MCPKIRGKPPKWMVKIMENPIKMDDLGCFFPYFWKHPYWWNGSNTSGVLQIPDHGNIRVDLHGNVKYPPEI